LTINTAESKAMELSHIAIEQSPHPILTINWHDGSITRINPALERRTGFSSSELIGLTMPYPWWFDQKSQGKLERGRKAALEKKGRKFEQKCITKYGEVFWIEVTPAAIIIDSEPEYLLNIWTDITDRKKREKDIKNFLSATITAHEDERRYIACELHDEVIQRLAALLLHFEATIRRRSQSNKDITHGLIKFQDELGDVVDHMRRFCRYLRPDILEHVGLVPSLEILAADLGKGANIEIDLEVTGQPRRLDFDKELGIFRICQEALKNVVKHSGASAAWVTLQFEPEHFIASIVDNGRGFEGFERIEDLAIERKLGLLGMRERARLLKGQLDIHSELHRGTTIHLTIPTKSARKIGSSI